MDPFQKNTETPRGLRNPLAFRIFSTPEHGTPDPERVGAWLLLLKLLLLVVSY